MKCSTFIGFGAIYDKNSLSSAFLEVCPMLLISALEDTAKPG